MLMGINSSENLIEISTKFKCVRDETLSERVMNVSAIQIVSIWISKGTISINQLFLLYNWNIYEGIILYLNCSNKEESE